MNRDKFLDRSSSNLVVIFSLYPKCLLLQIYYKDKLILFSLLRLTMWFQIAHQFVKCSDETEERK